MVCLHQRTPFRKDILEKLLEDQFRRNKSLSIELVSRLCELMGLNCQLASIKTKYFSSIEAPSIVFLRDVPVVIFSAEIDHIVAVHPHRGIIKIDYAMLKLTSAIFVKSLFLGEQVLRQRVVLVGIGLLLIKKYVSSSLVFVASLLVSFLDWLFPYLFNNYR